MTLSPNDASGTLINIGDLAKPASLLIEKIADATGGYLRPWQIERIARAEAKAAVIKANSERDVCDIQARTQRRLLETDLRNQSNIEAITRLALPHLSPDAAPNKMEADWVAGFFDRAKLVSNEIMQQLWASLLAGEANKPGSFSKRTIHLVSTLEMRDAELFTRLCSYVWRFGSIPRAVIFDVNQHSKYEPQLNFGSLSHLDNIGLIQTFFGVGNGFSVSDNAAANIVASYFGNTITFRPAVDDKRLPVGSVLLTEAGTQLAGICASVPNFDYFYRTLEEWTGQGHLRED